MADYEVIHYIMSPYDNATNKIQINAGTRIYEEPAWLGDPNPLNIQPSGCKWSYAESKLYYNGDGGPDQVCTLTEAGPPWTKAAKGYTIVNGLDLEDITWVAESGNIWAVSEDEQSLYEIKAPGTAAGDLRTIALPAHTGTFESFEWMPASNATYGGYFVGGIQGYNLLYCYEVDVTNFASVAITEKFNMTIGGGGYDNSGMDYDRDARLLYIHHGGNGINHVVYMDPLSIGGLRAANGMRGKIIDTFGITEYASTGHQAEGFTIDKTNRRCFFAEDNQTNKGYLHKCAYDPHGTIDASGLFTGGDDHVIQAYPDPGYRVKEWRRWAAGDAAWTLSNTQPVATSYTLPALAKDTIVTVQFEVDTTGSAAATRQFRGPGAFRRGY